MLFQSYSNVEATATLGTFDLVDSGKHLDWDGSTKYMTQWYNAVNTWNGYKKGVIRVDKWNTVQDIKVKDSSKKSESIAETFMATGDIVLYTKNMDKFTEEERQHTITHEIGHALGLGHNNQDNNAIMQQGRKNQIKLGKDDKKGYDAAYKRY